MSKTIRISTSCTIFYVTDIEITGEELKELDLDNLDVLHDLLDEHHNPDLDAIDNTGLEITSHTIEDIEDDE